TNPRWADNAEERAVVEHALHRQLPGARAAPQQIGSRGLGLAPVLESIETPVGHAQHARLESRQQVNAELPLAGAVRPEVGAQNCMRGALDQHGASGLRVTRVASHAGAAAGVAEAL